MTDYSISGLNDQQVTLSRKEHGTNTLTHKKRQNFFRQYLSNFGDPIIKVLLAALGINVLFLFRNHDWYESVGIAIAVFLATFVSTLSEYGSESAFEKLQEEAARICCRVRRNGKLCSVSMEEIVVGDIVLLQSGERVPADGLLIEGSLRVDQSALNGESEETEKYTGQHENELTLTGISSLFRGSVICSGSGTMRVVKVGEQTIYGQVADELQEETRESPLKLRLSGLAKTLSRIGFVAAGAVGVADLFNSIVIQNGYSLSMITAACSDIGSLSGHVLHAITLAITVVVVAVPEGLPMMITVVLSSNMRRMLKDQVLVRKLVGIETSG
ncbi:MAG: HAD-IC family P-type ATPase, partial [Clostridia bacterium]|nr:HAD-IC family P-type ATPase [Clostridia bacterium]